MGKLRSALEGLAKNIDLADRTAGELVDKLGSAEHNTSKLKAMGAEGIDMLYQYLESKLKKDGKKIDDPKIQKTAIGEYQDSTVGKFLGGIKDARESALKARGGWDKSADALDKCLKDLKDDSAAIDKLISAKKGKLLSSAAFKQKVKIYEGWLAGLDKCISGLAARVNLAKNMNEAPDEAQIKRVLSIDAGSTLGELSTASGKGVKELIKKYEDVEQNIQTVRRGVRDAGDFKAQQKMVATWLKEADDVDEEMEKKD